MNPRASRPLPNLLRLAAAFACAMLLATALAGPFEDAQAAYRAGQYAQAATLLEPLVKAKNIDAVTLLGYVRYRQGKLEEAIKLFELAQASSPKGNADALFGLALVKRVQGDLLAARKYALEAIKLAPNREDIREVLNTLPYLPEELVVTAYQKPSVTDKPFKAAKGYLRGSSDAAIIVRGVNMGVALPGKFPSQFPPDEGTYLDWFKLLGEMNANVIRVYTILPPVFYQALRSYNLEHAKRPLYIMHGVWTELPEELDTTDLPTLESLALHDYRGAFEKQFVEETHRVIDVVHGHAAISPRPGHAGGLYKADVSPWLIGYLVGREWEPFSMTYFNDQTDAPTTYRGPYIQAVNVTRFEAWIASVLDQTVSYEMEMYNAQRPVSTIGWPTTDPLHHISEATLREDYELRKALGQQPDKPSPVGFNEDEVTLDMTKITATAAFPAGVFAAYHAYPYYPDFLNNEAKYQRAVSRFGPSNYYGYLQDLKAYHGDQPIVIAEYGVPSSRANAHQNPFGLHHGSHSEENQARINTQLSGEIEQSGMAGGIVFALMDEWFKKNWLVYRLERPAERRPMWHSMLDAEQNYGLIAAEPADALRLRGLPSSAWKSKPALSSNSNSSNPKMTVKSFADAEYLHVLIETPLAAKDTLELAIDTHPDGGVALPWIGSNRAEFRIKLEPTQGYLNIVNGYAPFINSDLNGFEFGAWDARAHPPLIEGNAATLEAAWTKWLTQTNRERIGRDSTIYPRKTWDEGVLRQGLDPVGGRNPMVDYTWTPNGVQLRLPWVLLMFTDPSSRRVFDGKVRNEANKDANYTRQVKDIGLNARTMNGSTTKTSSPALRYTWPTWEEPKYAMRNKPAYYAFQKAWAANFVEAKK
jgi:tetratricopeptide (TPR) repeat protein